VTSLDGSLRQIKQLGISRPWRDSVDGGAAAREFERSRSREADQCGFGGGMSGPLDNAENCQTRDVDDPPPFLFRASAAIAPARAELPAKRTAAGSYLSNWIVLA